MTMRPRTADRLVTILLLLAAAFLLAVLLWPLPAHSEPAPVGPRTAASLLVVSPDERAVTGADLAGVELRLLALEQRLSMLIAGAAAVLTAVGVMLAGGRVRLTAGPLTVETGGPPDAPPPPR